MKDKMHTGELYFPGDNEIMREQEACLERLYEFNKTRPSQMKQRRKLLKSMFAEIGENCYIEPPFYADFGGKHIHFGNDIYLNFGVTMVDDTHIYVGDKTMIGPNVTVVTATHPLEPELRSEGYQYNKPVHIGENCFIGARAVILPGVTIGSGSVIGAGSVVTKDIPENVVAAGNPCKIIRRL